MICFAFDFAMLSPCQYSTLWASAFPFFSTLDGIDNGVIRSFARRTLQVQRNEVDQKFNICRQCRSPYSDTTSRTRQWNLLSWLFEILYQIACVPFSMGTNNIDKQRTRLWISSAFAPSFFSYFTHIETALPMMYL